MYLGVGIRSLSYGSLIKCAARTFVSNGGNLNHPVVTITLLQKHRCLSIKIPKDENEDILVYHGVLSSQIRAVKLLTLCSSMTGIMVQPLLYQQLSNFPGLASVIAVYTFVGFFTCVTPFLLHRITKKYIMDIYFNSSSGEYTAYVYTFFLRKRMIKFTPDDVSIPDVPGMLTSFHIKGEPVFVDPRSFEDPAHYANIMGFNKPLDFKIENNDFPVNKKKD